MLLSLILCGSAVAAPPPAAGDLGSRAVRAARYFVANAPVGFSPDCAGFVAASFHRVGVPLAGSPRWMWDRAAAAGALHFRPLPSPGDIVFFDDTYDKDRDGLRDDPLTHVALVLTVDPVSGDVLMAHGGATSGRAFLRMNLLHPSDPVRNDGLRRPSARPAGGPVLAGELFVGFASVHAEDLPVWLGLAGAAATP